MRKTLFLKGILTFLLFAFTVPSFSQSNFHIEQYNGASAQIMPGPDSYANLINFEMVNSSMDQVEITGITIIAHVETDGLATVSDLQEFAAHVKNIQFGTDMGCPQPISSLHYDSYDHTFNTFGITGGYTIDIGARSYLSVGANLMKGIDKFHVRSLSLEVSVTGIDVSTKDILTETALSEKTFIVKCINAAKITAQDEYVSIAPAYSVPIGTFIIKNTAPGMISVFGCDMRLQGNVHGTIPETDFAQMVNKQTGESIGVVSISGQSSNIYLSFNNEMQIAPGDSAAVVLMINIPVFGYGDELSAGVSFKGNMLPYEPWGITTRMYIETEYSISQKVLYGGMSGVASITSNEVSFITTGDLCTVYVPTDGTWNILIYDMSGKCVMKKENVVTAETVYARDLPKGVYIANVHSGNKAYNRKFSLN